MRRSRIGLAGLMGTKLTAAAAELIFLAPIQSLFLSAIQHLKAAYLSDRQVGRLWPASISPPI